MENTKIQNCSCQDTDQDKLYGKGKRLMNAYGKPRKGYKCTVCRKDHSDTFKTKK